MIINGFDMERVAILVVAYLLVVLIDEWLKGGRGARPTCPKKDVNGRRKDG
jgi:hypothetical protein